MRKQFAELNVQVEHDQDDGDDTEIMANAWHSFSAFIACQTQWRAVAGMTGLIWLGLDYLACKQVLLSLDFEREQRKSAFNDLRFMEAAALPILNEVA
ncbi:hypothetical protein RHAB21_00723 [Pseudorhizobium halotolerans]|uniref:DUF1799 domain-containing protein n=1 Tax=Pseudorhizobium halotolerans TaxID=1233081 RepID=A0ABN7JZJ0_9HYPH|nr:DUF1799 domain-containing protein [Pseudorhizobium halotolerans]CAD7055463.1 hypothetical protein RHAB21_00723 [Pseudorhizobium halotolerans]